MTLPERPEVQRTGDEAIRWRAEGENEGGGGRNGDDGGSVRVGW